MLDRISFWSSLACFFNECSLCSFNLHFLHTYLSVLPIVTTNGTSLLSVVSRFSLRQYLFFPGMLHPQALQVVILENSYYSVRLRLKACARAKNITFFTRLCHEMLADVWRHQSLNSAGTTRCTRCYQTPFPSAYSNRGLGTRLCKTLLQNNHRHGYISVPIVTC